MKSKFLKLVSVLCVLVIIASSSLFSVSANVYDDQFQELNCSFGDSVVDAVYLVLENVDTGSGEVVIFDSVIEKDNNRGAQLVLRNNKGFNKGERYFLGIYLRVDNDAYLNSSNYVSGSFRIGFTSERFRMIQDSTGDSMDYLAYTYRTNASSSTSLENYTQFGSLSYLSTQYGNYVDCIFPYNRPGETYNYYYTSLYITPTINYFESFSLMLYYWDFNVVSQSDKAAQDIINNQNENTDKILGAGSDVSQPDFNSTNSKLDSTVGEMNSIEGEYVIDKDATRMALDKGTSFIQGTDLQQASIQVKKWLERFNDDNRVITGFLIAVMCLGLCFWIIGRKAYSE